MATIHSEERGVRAKRKDGSTETKTVTRHVVRWSDPNGKQRERTFDTKTAAKDWAIKVENDKRAGIYADPNAGRVAFAKYSDRWLETKRAARRRPSTINSYALNLRVHVLPTFGACPLVTIQRSDVQAWVDGLGQRLGPNTTRTVYGHLASIFREAVRDRLITHTPCDRITLPAKVATEVSPLTADQVHALAEAIHPRYRALVITGAGTGLRPSELFGLTVDRIDFLRRTVKVDRQLSRETTATGGPVFGPPKTAASKRVVPLPQVVADTLAAHLAEYGEGPCRLVFTNTGRGATGTRTTTGRAIQRNAFDETWKAAVTASGLPGHTTPHDLRHTYASLLIAQGENPKVIQTRMGHAQVSETFDTYGHLFPTADEATRAAIDGALGAAPSQAQVMGRTGNDR